MIKIIHEQGIAGNNYYLIIQDEGKTRVIGEEGAIEIADKYKKEHPEEIIEIDFRGIQKANKLEEYINNLNQQK